MKLVVYNACWLWSTLKCTQQTNGWTEFGSGSKSKVSKIYWHTDDLLPMQMILQILRMHTTREYVWLLNIIQIAWCSLDMPDWCSLSHYHFPCINYMPDIRVLCYVLVLFVVIVACCVSCTKIRKCVMNRGKMQCSNTFSKFYCVDVPLASAPQLGAVIFPKHHTYTHQTGHKANNSWNKKGRLGKGNL